MRYYFTVFLLVGIVCAFVLTDCQRANPVAVNESQQSGVVGEDPAETIEGTFWIDRWGQGRFPPYVGFVDESVFPKLVDHAGVPIRISKPIALGEQQPGDLLLSSFHRLERLPQSVSLRLRWKTTDNKTSENPILRTRSPLDASIEVHVTNNDRFDVLLTSEDFRFFRVVRHPRNSYSYGVSQYVRKRGALRYDNDSADCSPQGTKYTLDWMKATFEQPPADLRLPLKAGATFSWTVAISDWEPNEYELMVKYRKHDNPSNAGVTYAYSNQLSLDVLTDEPRQNDVVEMHVRQRDKTELVPGQPVPLEILFINKSETELVFPLWKGTKDDLDLSDMLFCYGSDGRILPLTTKVAGPMEIRIPINESFTLPVDAPQGTVVSRAVFFNPSFSPKIGSHDPNRFEHGWHWSEHWQHPSVRAQFP